jgi:signal transduction histidine kinase
VSTLDQSAIMRVVSSMALPLLGAWACVYLVDDAARVFAVDFAAVDERQRSLLRQVVRQLPITASEPRLPWTRAMRTQEPILLAPVDDDFYDALGTAELRDFVAALAPRSIVSVPLIARGRVIGGITFGTCATGRIHDEQDLLAAREVALPAGLALDTARVYEEQRRAKQEAEVARQRAEDANLSKVDFLRAMSHELRTPLNAIGGYVQLMQMGVHGELNERLRRDIERIDRNQQHVSRLINDVLSFARLETGRIEYAPRRVALATILASLDDFVAPLVGERTHQLEVRSCGDDVHVIADPDKATQVLVNLISNALKHTPAGSRIEVFRDGTPAGRDGPVRVCVRDNGPGIAVDQQAAIFQPFVQLGKSLSRPIDGLGLGLAIARDLARGMEGSLTVDSMPGAGTTFTLALPRG